MRKAQMMQLEDDEVQDENDNFGGFGSLTEMYKHKDDLVK